MYAIRRSINLRKLVKAAENNGSAVSQVKTYYTYSPEPSQLLDREPTFCSVEDAVKCVKSGKSSSTAPISRVLVSFRHAEFGLECVTLIAARYTLKQFQISQNNFYSTRKIDCEMRE